MMLRGEFREDLYYRLKVIEAVVPPLRERPRRDPAAHRLLHRQVLAALQPAGAAAVRRAAAAVPEYDWPGNVRELENMIKRFVILQDEQLVLRELSKAARRRPSPLRHRRIAGGLRAAAVPVAAARPDSWRSRVRGRGRRGRGRRGTRRQRRPARRAAGSWTSRAKRR